MQHDKKSRRERSWRSALVRQWFGLALGMAAATSLQLSPHMARAEGCRELAHDGVSLCNERALAGAGLLAFQQTSNGRLAPVQDVGQAPAKLVVQRNARGVPLYAALFATKPIIGLSVRAHQGKLLLRAADSAILLDLGRPLSSIVSVEPEDEDEPEAHAMGGFPILLWILSCPGHDVPEPTTEPTDPQETESEQGGENTNEDGGGGEEGGTDTDGDNDTGGEQGGDE